MAKDDLYGLPIPNISAGLKASIRLVFQECFAKNRDSAKLMTEAEMQLNKAIGLENWQAPEPLSYVRSSGEGFAAGRLDAEHFQPKFDNTLNIVRRKGIELVPIENITCSVVNGFDARDFIDEGTPYIRVGDIKNGRININSAARIALSASDITKDIALREGDILFTRKGSFGNAAPVLGDQQHAVISSEIMLLRLREAWSERILPEYVATFFNSIFGKLQSEKWAHGVAFYSISQDDLNRFLVPILPIDKQLTIRNALTEGERARQRANQLLDAAKRAVEIAIESSESDALAFLDQTLAETGEANS